MLHVDALDGRGKPAAYNSIITCRRLASITLIFSHPVDVGTVLAVPNRPNQLLGAGMIDPMNSLVINPGVHRVRNDLFEIMVCWS